MSNGCCSRASLELKLYQAFIFCVPIFFTVILLFLFYLFYLRRRRHHWPSLRSSRNLSFSLHSEESDESSRAELGLKKELRELLPIIVFRESFSVKDPQCSVCLGDYQAEERLQQIPACGHTFHLNCIDNWLTNHATCPLCRQSLLVSVTASTQSQLPAIPSEANEDTSFVPQNVVETPVENDVSHLNHQQVDESSHDMNGLASSTPSPCNDDQEEVHRPGVSIKTNDEGQRLPSLDVRD